MKIRKCQITRKLCNYIFKILFTCFLFFFLLAFQTFIKIFVCLFCFVFIYFLVFEFFVVLVFLKNSQLITKVGKNRLNMEKNKF